MQAETYHPLTPHAGDSFSISCTRPTKKELVVDRFSIKAGIIAGSSGLSAGYNLGVITGALPQIVELFRLSNANKSLLVTLFYIGTVVGCVIGGFLCDRFGRRRVMQLQNLIIVLGTVMMISAYTSTALLLGRFLVGIGYSFAIASSTPYLLEISPEDSRGQISSSFKLMQFTGALLSSVFSLAFSSTKDGWRWMLAPPVLFSIAQTAGLVCLPESPKWLVENGNLSGAYSALLTQLPQGDDMVSEAKEMLQLLVEKRDNAAVMPCDWAATVWEYRTAFLLLSLFNGLGPFTGYIVVRNYFVTMMADAGIAIETAYVCNAAIGAVNLLVAIVSTRYIDILGRRRLLLLGLAVAAIGLAVIATAYVICSDKNWLLALLLVGFTLNAVGFNVGIGLVGLTITAEMLPVSIRGRGSSAMALCRNISSVVSNGIYLFAVTSLGYSVTLGFFIVINFVVFGLVFSFFVETMGLDPADILARISGRYQLLPIDETTSETLTAD